MENIARSVVDERQPFFRIENRTLTYQERVAEPIHKSPLLLDKLNCMCWRCNKSGK